MKTRASSLPQRAALLKAIDAGNSPMAENLDEQQLAARNVAMLQWLNNNQRAGYIPAFESIVHVKPSPLDWCTVEDLVAVFTALKPCEATAGAQKQNDAQMLAQLFAGLSVNSK